MAELVSTRREKLGILDDILRQQQAASETIAQFSQFYLGLPFASLSIPRSNIFLPGREQSGPIPPFDFLGVAILAVFLAVLPSTSSNA